MSIYYIAYTYHAQSISNISIIRNINYVILFILLRLMLNTIYYNLISIYLS